jgi:hypothetical protein
VDLEFGFGFGREADAPPTKILRFRDDTRGIPLLGWTFHLTIVGWTCTLMMMLATTARPRERWAGPCIALAPTIFLLSYYKRASFLSIKERVFVEISRRNNRSIRTSCYMSPLSYMILHLTCKIPPKLRFSLFPPYTKQYRFAHGLLHLREAYTYVPNSDFDFHTQSKVHDACGPVGRLN